MSNVQDVWLHPVDGTTFKKGDKAVLDGLKGATASKLNGTEVTISSFKDDKGRYNVYTMDEAYYLLPVQSHEIFWQHSDSNLPKSHTKKALFIFP